MAENETVTDEVFPGQERASGLKGQSKYQAAHQARRARKMMRAFHTWAGDKQTETRRAEIRALPRKWWKGRIVVRLVCADCGKERWEGEYVAWSLVSLDRHICSWCLVRG